MITRPENQSEIFINKLKDLGANPIVFPVIEIVPPVDYTEMDEKINALDEYDWLVLTSVNGANFFIDRILKLADNLKVLDHLKIAVVGSITEEELIKKGLKVAFVPSKYVADTIGEELPINKGDKILFPRSTIARKKVINRLKERGAIIDELAAYQTQTCIHDALKMKEILAKQIDFITFTSASCVNGLRQNLKKHSVENLPGRIACIGPITKKAAEKHAFQVNIMAEPYTVDGLIQQMLKC